MYFLPEHRAPVVRGNHLGSLLPLSLRRVYKHVHKRARARSYAYMHARWQIRMPYPRSTEAALLCVTRIIRALALPLI